MPFPRFDPVLVHLGPFAIRWYALAYITGILVGWRYAVGLIRRPALWGPAGAPISPVQMDDLVLWITLGVIAGGRTGYVLFYGRGQFAGDPWEVFRTWHGGMSFHGGFLGVAVVIAVYSLVRRIDARALGDLIAPCAPIGLFFGRIANFINGELWGRPTRLPWGMVFPSAPDALPRHPSQIYEAALEGLVLFLILRIATHRAGLLKRRGAVTGIFLIGYGCFRCLLETVRNPDIGMPEFPFGLTMGIILSLPMIAAGLALVALARPAAAAPEPGPGEHAGA